MIASSSPSRGRSFSHFTIDILCWLLALILGIAIEGFLVIRILGIPISLVRRGGVPVPFPIVFHGFGHIPGGRTQPITFSSAPQAQFPLYNSHALRLRWLVAPPGLWSNVCVSGRPWVGSTPAYCAR
jgi:hypothetical protein